MARRRLCWVVLIMAVRGSTRTEELGWAEPGEHACVLGSLRQTLILGIEFD
jgi:hypothetical protein